MNKTTIKAVDFRSPVYPGAAASLARPGFLPPPAPQSSESAADRVMLTLLALGLMLLAFFVVLTSAASFDQKRIKDVVRSVQMTFEHPEDSKTETIPPAPLDAAYLAAVGALRAAVADVFAFVLSGDNPKSLVNSDRVNPDRVEIDVPVAVFFAQDAKEVFPLTMLNRIVDLINDPPAGYRLELVVRASASADTQPANRQMIEARLAALADDLVHRGLPAPALSVGALEEGKAADTTASTLRFTFLLLDTDEDLAAVKMMNAPPAEKAVP